MGKPAATADCSHAASGSGHNLPKAFTATGGDSHRKSHQDQQTADSLTKEAELSLAGNAPLFCCSCSPAAGLFSPPTVQQCKM